MPRSLAALGSDRWPSAVVFAPPLAAFAFPRDRRCRSRSSRFTNARDAGCLPRAAQQAIAADLEAVVARHRASFAGDRRWRSRSLSARSSPPSSRRDRPPAPTRPDTSARRRCWAAAGWFIRRSRRRSIARMRDPCLTSPLGWRPARGRRAWQSPTYPPGLPLLMAIPHAVARRRRAPSLVVIAVGGDRGDRQPALLAAQLGGGVAGLIAAVLLAFTPVFIFQSIQPMSDVPVTAAWMVCFCCSLVRRRDAAVRRRAGIACALAVLIRPNLAPLAIVPLHHRAQSRSRSRFRWRLPALALALSAVALVRIAVAIRIRVGRGTVLRSRTSPPTCRGTSAGWSRPRRSCCCRVFGFWRLRRDRSAQALMAFAALVIGVVPGLRGLRRLVVPALPAAGDGGARGVHGGGAVGVDRSMAVAAVARRCCSRSLLLVTAHGIWVTRVARHLQARRSIAARVARSPTTSTPTCRPPR